MFRPAGRGLVSLNRLMMTGAALCALSAPVLAQEGQTQLSTINVEAGAASGTGPVKGYAAKASATGSKSDTPIKEIPQSVSVIGREELADRGVTNKVDEALRYTAGVLSEPFGQDPDTDWIYIRGFDATQTGAFLDGLNLYSYGFGGFQIDPFFLERVDVLKGPASVLYGGSNPGGLVNMVSKRPLGERHVYTETGINNFGNAFFGFDAGDVANDGALAYRVTGKVSGGSNYSDFSKDFRGAIMPQVEWTPDDSTRLNVYGYVSALDQVHVGNGFFPYVGTVVDAPFGKLARDSFYGEPSIDNGNYQQFMAGYEFEKEFENGLTFTQNARYGHLNKHETGPYVYGYYDPATSTGYLENPVGPNYTLNRIGFEGKSEVNSFAMDNRFSMGFETGGVSHDLIVGLDYKFYQLDHVQACCGATPISVVNPNYGATQGANFVYLDQELTQHQLGVYMQDQIRFGGGWLATLNGRYDFVHTESDAAIGYSYDSDDGALSGRAGLAYEFANGLTPFISTATFFTPIVGASATAPIKPEEGYQFEGGVKYEPAGGNALYTASVFHLVKRNWTVTDPATFLQSQIGEVTSTGIELEAKVDLAADWKLIGAFTYQHLEMTEHADRSLIGNSPYLIPDVSASLWVDYTVPTGALEGLSIGGGLRYQGESWADYANTKKVPDVLVADAAIRYTKDGWAAALNINNLFDTEYVKGCQGTLTCGYGDGRTVTLKISKSW